MSVNMHSRRVEPNEERLAGFVLPVDEIEGGIQKFFVNSFHTLFCQGPCIFDGLFADTAKAWIFGSVVLRAGFTPEHAAWTEFRAKLRVLWIVGILRLFLSIQMVKVSEKLVEAMYGWQELVPVTQVILTELACSVTVRFE